MAICLPHLRLSICKFVVTFLWNSLFSFRFVVLSFSSFAAATAELFDTYELKAVINSSNRSGGSRVKTSLSVWHFQGLLIRVCFCVPAVSSGCSRQTGSEWRRPWKTVTSLLAEWDTKTLKLPSFFCHAVSSCLPLCLWTCCPFFSATLSYLHLRALSSSSSSSIHPSVCPLTVQLVLYSPETAADWCFAHLCGVVFSGCLHDFPLRTDLALVVMKQIDPVGAIEMTKKLFYLYLSSDISGEKRPPHALRCKHSPHPQNTANKFCTPAVASNLHVRKWEKGLFNAALNICRNICTHRHGV